MVRATLRSHSQRRAIVLNIVVVAFLVLVIYKLGVEAALICGLLTAFAYLVGYVAGCESCPRLELHVHEESEDDADWWKHNEDDL